MNTPDQSLLGKPTAYADHYDATLLFPMERAPKRHEIGITGALPFFGADLWTAFELSWLNPRGKPQVAIAHITVPCETPNIVESKSLKLYLGSFSNTVFASADAVRERLRTDLAEALWRGGATPASIGVEGRKPTSPARSSTSAAVAGTSPGCIGSSCLIALTPRQSSSTSIK